MKWLSEFSFQPNMVLPIQPSWRRFEDYLEAMSSKYRVRARRAVKKMDGLTRRELSETMVELEEKAMYALYREVASMPNSMRLSCIPVISRP